MTCSFDPLEGSSTIASSSPTADNTKLNARVHDQIENDANHWLFYINIGVNNIETEFRLVI